MSTRYENWVYTDSGRGATEVQVQATAKKAGVEEKKACSRRIWRACLKAKRWAVPVEAISSCEGARVYSVRFLRRPQAQAQPHYLRHPQATTFLVTSAITLQTRRSKTSKQPHLVLLLSDPGPYLYSSFSGAPSSEETVCFAYG